MEQDMNKYIKKSHIRKVAEFNDELRKWSEYTNGTPDGEAELYEDINTPFTLSNVRVEDGRLKFRYDGKEEQEEMLYVDEEDGSLWEKEGMDDIMDYLKFWRACLGRAKRYFAMDPDKLDRMADGEEEDDDDEE